MKIEDIKTVDDLWLDSTRQLVDSVMKSDDKQQKQSIQIAIMTILNSGIENVAEENQLKLINLMVTCGFIQQQLAVNPETQLEALTFEAKQIAAKEGEESAAYIAVLNSIRGHLSANPESINEQWEFDVTPLHEAACSNLVKLTNLFLEFNPNKTLKNTMGETASERAHKMGLAKIVNLIN